MGKYNFDFVRTEPNQGSQQATIVAPGNLAIPPLDSTLLPKFLLCVVSGGTAGAAVAISPQVAATNGAVATGIPLVIGGNSSIILNVMGYSHIGFEDIQGATCNLNLIPLSDF